MGRIAHLSLCSRGSPSPSERAPYPRSGGQCPAAGRLLRAGSSGAASPCSSSTGSASRSSAGCGRMGSQVPALPARGRGLLLLRCSRRCPRAPPLSSPGVQAAEIPHHQRLQQQHHERRQQRRVRAPRQPPGARRRHHLPRRPGASGVPGHPGARSIPGAPRSGPAAVARARRCSSYCSSPPPPPPPFPPLLPPPPPPPPRRGVFRRAGTRTSPGGGEGGRRARGGRGGGAARALGHSEGGSLPARFPFPRGQGPYPTPRF